MCSDRSHEALAGLLVVLTVGLEIIGMSCLGAPNVRKGPTLTRLGRKK
jgi:hypothetical protein